MAIRWSEDDDDQDVRVFEGVKSCLVVEFGSLLVLMAIIGACWLLGFRVGL